MQAFGSMCLNMYLGQKRPNLKKTQSNNKDGSMAQKVNEKPTLQWVGIPRIVSPYPI